MDICTNSFTNGIGIVNTPLRPLRNDLKGGLSGLNPIYDIICVKILETI